MGERTPGCNWQTQVVGPREEWDFNVQQGVTYIWSFQQGGGSAGWDTQLTGFYEGPQTVAFFNDDFGGFLQSEVTWTSDWTGQIDVLTNRYNCQGWGSSGSATLAYRKATPSVSIDQSASYNTCSGNASLSASVIYDANNTASWTRIGGQGTITSSGQVSGIPPNSSGTFQAQADNGGCTATDVITVYNRTPTPVTVSSGGGGTYCGQVLLTASGGAGGTIYWQGTTAGGVSTATPSTSQLVTSSGTYYFRAVDPAAGCWSDQGSVTVTIVNPVVTDPVSTSICEGESVQLVGNYSNGISPSYQWQVDVAGAWVDVSNNVPNVGAIYSGANSQALSIDGLTQSASYRLQINDAGPNCGISNTAAATVTVNSQPDALDAITTSGSGCGSLTLTANSNEITGGGYTAEWFEDANNNGTLEEGIDLSLGSGTTIQATTVGTYDILARQRNISTGCSGPATALNITIGQTFAITTTSTDVTCNGGGGRMVVPR